MARPAFVSDAAAALLPALLLLAAGGWWGTFPAGAGAWAAIAAQASIVAFALLGAGAWRDPLRLGRGAPLLYAALAVALVASYRASPVARAGHVGLLLLPAFLLLPAAVARCWSSPRRRRLGVAGVAAVVAAVAAWSLIAWMIVGGERPALPLGHHNLLATWLVALLPLAWTAGARPGAGRALAATATAAAVAAVLLSRSLAGAVALLVVAILSLRALRRGPHRIAALVLLALFAAPSLPRLMRMAAAEDASTGARLAYAEAAVQGVSARPLLGWGPGAAAWTGGRFLGPRPGVLPAGDVASHFHSLPLDLGYELGVAGALLVLAIAGLFVLRRRRARQRARGLRRGALLGLLGLAVAALGGLPLAVIALPVAAAVLAGGALATEVPPARPRDVLLVYALLAAFAAGLVAPDRAHLAYDRARSAGDFADSVGELRAALRHDPSFPLYRARLAWLTDDAAGALAAARAAPGVAALWFAAGVQGQNEGAPWADRALVTACRLDPFGPFVPFRLAIATPGHKRLTVDRAARALAVEPRLLAATTWRQRMRLRLLAVGRLRATPGIDADWRDAIARLTSATWSRRSATTSLLELNLDAEAATSLSLHLFRRAPWPTTLDAIELDAEALARIDLGPASSLPGVDPQLFRDPDCALRDRQGTRLDH
ncbi:MAG: O-antigen ligase domain-containing protein [Acidobacteria bacterium]|nr:MAG: O-antigen ligase domain-containing protein [Acidobacteriota bacterium]